MFKQIALVATLALTTTAPAFAYNEAAGREFDRQYEAAVVALDRQDYNAFCQYEANQKALMPFIRPGVGAGWDKQVNLTNKNLRLCAEEGRPTTPNINVAQYTQPAAVPGLPAGMTMAEAVTLAQGGVSGEASLDLDDKCRAKFGGGAYYDRMNSVPSRGEYVCRNGSAGRAGTL